MKPRERVYEQLAHRKTDFSPYVLDMFDEVADALDMHYGSRDWREKLDNHIHKVPIWRLPWDPPGSRHVKDAYGAVWRSDLLPAQVQIHPLSGPSLNGYKFPTPDEVLVENWEEIVREERERRPNHFLAAMIGTGVWEIVWYLRGMENALADVALEPKFFEELTCAIADHIVEVVDRVIDLPVDGLMFGDDWGHQRGLFLGGERWRRFLKPNLRRIYDRIHAGGKIALTHCCGCIVDVVPDVIEIGLDVLESVQPEAMDPYMLKKEYGKDITFWGGLGSQSTLQFGTPTDIRAEVHRLCNEMGAGGGYILGPAKPLRPEMPVENAVAALESFLGQAGVSL